MHREFFIKIYLLPGVKCRMNYLPCQEISGHFNKYSGKLIWTFHTIPKPGEYGSETWSTTAPVPGMAEANCWAGMALIFKEASFTFRQHLPSFDFYGADRPGQNLFANCLLVLDATTGKRVWHFQTTHHDLWDRDNGHHRI